MWCGDMLPRCSCVQIQETKEYAEGLLVAWSALLGQVRLSKAEKGGERMGAGNDEQAGTSRQETLFVILICVRACV